MLLLSALIPATALLSLIVLGKSSLSPTGSNPTINASDLLYRWELPSDLILPIPELDNSTVFVAVQPDAEPLYAVVGSVVFGRVSTADYGDWVYIDAVDVRGDWRERGVGTEMLRRLLAYVKEGWPDVVGAYLVVQYFNKAAKGLYEKVGFAYRGETNCYDGYVFYFNSSSAAELAKDLPSVNMSLPYTSSWSVVDFLYDMFRDEDS
ncbi:hypothetical protein FOZ63_017311 [Perkinsus olseni]|uniref:N-acetyltransferase domain-containing protein n=2 Tax=Perkinsus olseni TaxID=32597 RepID=A0A7J6QMQ1_PEROL|nr:hypothetical protein FOZ63_017311 [Perkinsus olseni]